jgi:uncharacterized repeat protein (TIGR03803 family)
MRWLGPAAAFLAMALLGTAHAATLTTLYGNTEGTPSSRLAIDATGAIYGTTVGIGSNVSIVFRLANEGTPEAPTWSFSELGSFSRPDATELGRFQQPGLTLASDGRLYGVTPMGGIYDQGTAFRVDPGGSVETVFSFGASGTGSTPQSTLRIDGAGNLYGTTSASATPGQGTFFRLAPDGSGGFTHAVLGTGGQMLGEIGTDAAGSLYSTTYPADGNGQRAIQMLIRNANGSYSPGGTFAPLASLTGGQPAGVVIDSANRLFILDGNLVRADLNGSLNPTGFFSRSIGDTEATGGLLIDTVGNIFGTTSTTAFRLTPDGHGDYSFTTLATLPGLSVAGLVADADGNLYGSTINGDGSGNGTIFRISDAGFGIAPVVAPVATPEPATLALLGLAGALLAGARRRQAA